MRSEDISYIESKHILRLLGELNDIEIIILRAYYESHSTREIEFRNKHKDILVPITVPLGATQEKRDKSTLQESYKIHMERLGLLRVKYRMDYKTRMPEFDRDRGLKKEGYEITQLGILLIHQINDSAPKKITGLG